MRHLLATVTCLFLVACGGRGIAPALNPVDAGDAGPADGAIAGDGGDAGREDAGCGSATAMTCNGYDYCDSHTGQCICPLNEPHFAICDGGCTNLADDTNNCGVCGVVCRSDQGCAIDGTGCRRP
jgi:hypothetical protein